MKAIVPFILLTVLSLLFVEVLAQETKISGSITFPKSMVVPANFATSIKANMKVYKYDLVNGQLKNQQLADGLTVSVTSINTTDDANYYTLNYMVSGILPDNKAILVTINNFRLPSPVGCGELQFMFNISGKIAVVMPNAKKDIENYNFNAVSAFIRNNNAYSPLKSVESNRFRNLGNALVN